jgi:hypothetical protein
MNTAPTPLPDGDIRTATRDRFRDELIAIVDHESAQNRPRRRLAPLAAAAAVVAVTAGLAVGLPALRGNSSQPAVSGTGTGPAQPAVEPLTKAEKNSYVKVCSGATTQSYAVLDSFKWANPPAGTYELAWVIIKYKSGKYAACGFDAKGHQTGTVAAVRGDTQTAVIEKTAAGGGTYAKPVSRVTIAFEGGPATEAVLRNGFFFAPMKWKDTLVRPKPDSAPMYTIRGYDSQGRVVYASAPTFREEQAQLDGCYTNPEGTKVVMVFGGRKTTPPVSQCTRGVAWNW